MNTKWIYPKTITQDMVNRARVDSNYHTSCNLNAMLELGYCTECGLVPRGCVREGCGTSGFWNNGWCRLFNKETLSHPKKFSKIKRKYDLARNKHLEYLKCNLC